MDIYYCRLNNGDKGRLSSEIVGDRWSERACADRTSSRDLCIGKSSSIIVEMHEMREKSVPLRGFIVGEEITNN